MTYEVLKMTNITHHFGAKCILEDATLSLNRGDRAALVGENGAGKTTLAHIILGDLTPDNGAIAFSPEAEIGYLPQEVVTDEAITVHEYIQVATGKLHQLAEQIQHLEEQLETATAEVDQLLDQYGTLQAEFQRRGGYDLNYRIEQIFNGLAISYIDQDRALMSLSGGERTRVAITALLLSEPDLLILDEPTNHLDFAGLNWLENFLKSYPNALLLISHDRAFINTIVNQVIELSPTSHQLTIYVGDYDAYQQQREQQFQREYDAFVEQYHEMKRLQQLAKQQAHGRSHTGKMPTEDKLLRNAMIATGEKTQSKNIRDAKQRLAQLEANKLENPTRNWRIEFNFEPQPLTSTEPLRLENLGKQFGEHILFNGLDAVLRKGERAVLVSPNGAGKSTLLQIIMGLQTSDSGDITISQSVKMGYLDQDSLLLDDEQTVLESYANFTDGDENEPLTALHRSGLFASPQLAKQHIGDLSIGQRRKLAIAQLIASQANVLLLDEPTNHLDFASMEALENALLNFDGAVLAVSHDRRFIEQVATHIWQLVDGELRTEPYESNKIIV